MTNHRNESGRAHRENASRRGVVASTSPSLAQEPIALKIIDKQKLKRYKKENEVRVEKWVLSKLKHPSIVRLFHSFVDQGDMRRLRRLAQFAAPLLCPKPPLPQTSFARNLHDLRGTSATLRGVH